MKKRKVNPGVDHIDTIDTVYKLAQVLLKQGDSDPKAYGKAETHFIFCSEKYKVNFFFLKIYSRKKYQKKN
jgi:hypothetical protein